MNTKHTPEPWSVLNTGCIVNEVENVLLPSAVMTCKDMTLPHKHRRLAKANAKRIVECVNACAGQSIEDVKLATAYRDECFEWEKTLMGLVGEEWEKTLMGLVGEDGVGSVRTAIESLKKERDELIVAISIARNLMLKSGVTVDNADIYNILNKYVTNKSHIS
jgi:hypothetical protein